MTGKPPLAAPPARVRQRQRAGGGWRIWWEPTRLDRELGFEAVELDETRLTWSKRRAEALNRAALKAREAQATGARRAAGARTVEALAHRYLAGADFGALRPATQRDYRGAIRRITAKWGRSPVAFFTRAVVREWYETLHREAGVRMAQHELRVFSILFGAALDLGWCEANPCRDLRMRSAPPRERVATWAEVAALEAAAEALGLPSVALACRLSVLMGQRQADVLGARRGAILPAAEGRPAAWAFRQSKRGAVMWLPLHAELEAGLLALAEAGPPDAPLVLCETTGRAWAPDHFRHAFARVRAEAAKAAPTVADLQFRDLRRTFAVLAREGGASERDVSDGLGNTAWKDSRLSQTYMPPSAVTAGRAVAAVRRPPRVVKGKE